MSAFTGLAVLGSSLALGDLKTALVTVAGTASYDTGGSIVDLSSVFPSKVYSVDVVAVSAAASSKYRGSFIPGASSGPALGKIKFNDITAASGAEVSSTTDLSGTTFTLLVHGK